MQQDQLDCTSGQYSLTRPGANPKQPLRAWDAADEYLINLINTEYSNSTLLVLNDQFGALACALHKQISAWSSDSFCAKDALNQNLASNNLTLSGSQFDSITIESDAELAIMKIPKNTSFLEFQLNQCVKLGITKILLAGMMKHLPKTILNQLQKFGTVKRLPFVKKATVFELDVEKATTDSYPKKNHFESITLLSHANVFGRDKLDPGAQFFIENLQRLPNASHIADLCCGSGILGIKYAQEHPQSNVDFYDESFMAVESSKISWPLNNINNPANFIWADGLSGNANTYDLILCNPPFHEAHTVGDHIAKRLFKQSKAALNPHGKLIVVGNRHLQYHVTLKKYFKSVEQIASNPKFVLLSAHG
jgi:16S rRNA G1207 methylase RsmC